MSPFRLTATTFAGALLGLLAASLNGTPLLVGLTGGIIAGELAALLAPRDDDDGGIVEEAPADLELPLSTHA